MDVKRREVDILDRLVLDILLVAEKGVFNLLLGDFAEVTSVARSAGFVLQGVSLDFIPAVLSSPKRSTPVCLRPRQIILGSACGPPGVRLQYDPSGSPYQRKPHPACTYPNSLARQGGLDLVPIPGGRR